MREMTTPDHIPANKDCVGLSGAPGFSHPWDYRIAYTSAMGKHFGELAKIRGLIQYRLSPFEQRAFAGAISKGLPNIFVRLRSNIFRVLPPFVVAYLIYDTVEKKHHQLMRKNPKDYENDE